MLLLLANLVILGRLLTPLDFGLVAMVTAVVGVAELIRDFGITTASIQAPNLSKLQKNNLFWINVSLGVVLAAATASLSLPLATLYNDQRLALITLVISGLFVLNGIQAQFQVELTRQLRFTSLAVTDIVANTLGLGTAIILAVMGAGYWSLVAMQLASALCLLMFRVIAAGWCPGLPGRGGSIHSFLRYGGNLGLAQFVNYGSANAPSILIGIIGGPVILGSYTRAAQLASIPVNQIFGPLTNVALTALVRINGERKFSQTVGIMQLLLGYIAAVGFSLAIIFAHDIVRIVLGDQWSAVAEILQILAIGAIFQAATFVSYWVFLAKNETNELLKYNLVTKGLVLALTVVGILGSVHGMVWGYVAGLILAWPISLLWMRKIQLPVHNLFVGGLRFIICGVLTSTCGLLAPLLPLDLNPLTTSALGGLAGLSLACILPRIRRDLADIIIAVRRIRRSEDDMGIYQ